MEKGIKIGTYEVTKPTEVTQYYECAAWHKKIVAEPGAYDVVIYPYAEKGSVGHTLYVKTSGKVTSACFVSRLGSVYGRDDGPKEIGTVAEVALHLAPHWRVGQEHAGLTLDPAVAHIERFDGGDCGPMAHVRLGAEEIVPLCAAEMGCLCAGHARGDSAADPCDTRETAEIERLAVAEDAATESLNDSEYGRLVASLEGSFRG